MSIKQRQLDKIIEAILGSELKSGTLPSSRKFLLRLNQILMAHTLGIPVTHPVSAHKHSVVDIDTHNYLLSAIEEDLDTLYSESYSDINDILKNLNYFEIEKRKLNYELYKLEGELANLLLISDKSNQYVHSIYEGFADLDLVDVLNTTADIDIQNHEALLSKKLTNFKRISLPVSNITFTPRKALATAGNLQISNSGELSNILNDNINDVWMETITTSQDQIIIGELLIELSNFVSTNKITLDLHSPKETSVEILYCPDNLNWFRLPNSKVESFIGSKSYVFTQTDLIKLKVVLTKLGSDSITQQDNQTLFNSIFGIRNLSIFEAAYADTSSFYSTVQTIDKENFTIDKVVLSVDDEKPAGTWIDYFVAFPQDAATPVDPGSLWIPISPVEDTQPKYTQLLNLGNVGNLKTTFKIPSTTSPAEYELKAYNVNGIRFYKLGEVDKTISSSILYKGKNAWKVEQYNYDYGPTHVPSLNDWTMKPDTATNRSTSYQNINSGNSILMLSNKTWTSPINQKYTAAVFVGASQDIKFKSVGNANVIVLLNGKVVYDSSTNIIGDINIKLNLGWNVLQVLIYQAANVLTSLDITSTLLTYAQAIYAESTPLTSVSLFDLQYNVLSSDYNSYALDTTTTGTRVILNNYYPDLIYEMIYTYNIDEYTQVQFRADLGRKTGFGEVSPKIKSYQIRFM